MPSTLFEHTIPITQHAKTRMQQRRISQTQVDLVRDYGRHISTRDADFFVVGKNEVKRRPELIHCAGIHLVTSRDEGVVITVYRQHKLTLLKPKSRRKWAR